MVLRTFVGPGGLVNDFMRIGWEYSMAHGINHRLLSEQEKGGGGGEYWGVRVLQ